MSGPALKLDWCSPAAARWACEHWHYSGTLPTNKSRTIGVWEEGNFAGAVIFGLGAAPTLGKPYGLGIFECCELTRVALGPGHRAPVSRILAIASKMVKRSNAGLRLIVSFADPYEGHHGGIYQAGGWIYAGRSSASRAVLHRGRRLDLRRFNGHGFNKAKPLPAGAKVIAVPGKHRYLFPLDSDLRARILPLAQPYPKRARSDTSDTPSYHDGKGGAAPTLALSTGGKAEREHG